MKPSEYKEINQRKSKSKHDIHQQKVSSREKNVVLSIIYNNIKYNPVYETPALYYGFECWEMKKLVDKIECCGDKYAEVDEW